MKRIPTLPLLLSLLIVLLSPPSAHAAPRCFPEAAPAITACIDGRFAEYWARQGGLPVFGYPISPQGQSGALTVQLFERARLELHPENAPPYDVQLGRLGVDLLVQQGRDWQTFPKGDPTAAHFFAQTGHVIAPQFWGYWSSHGLELDGRAGITANEALALFGLPLSEAQTETNPTDGRPYLTQWFERARFEFHPEHAGTPNEVQLGLLQRELGAGVVAAPTPAPMPLPASAASSAPTGFIQANEGQLISQGQPVQIKGVNYYPQWYPWASMWRDWDAPQIERELRDGRDRLGINVVRVLLPYNFSGGEGGDGKVTPKLIGRLREISQIAGSLDLRLIVTLFDFSRTFSGPNTDLQSQNLNYLRALLPNFADDDRIMAWDLHNEPDNYGIWTAGDPGKVLDWLGRMADTVHALAPHQLVTVGMAQASSLWLPGPDGRRVIDYSDVVSMHSYDAGTVARDVAQLRTQTSKPIVIEEFGWPTGPACTENYSESTQTRLYQAVLDAAKQGTSGVVAWTLRDYDAGPTDRWDTREEHFGLIRPDGSLKPAADLLRNIHVLRLPSAMVTTVPLTSVHPHLDTTGSDAPLLIPGTGYHVKDRFRKAWELLGGRDSFGLPLSEAFERQSDGLVVQYFENTLLEFHAKSDAELRGLSEEEKARQEIQPADLGSAFAAGRSLPPAQPPRGPFLAFYTSNNGAWRLGNPISGELTETINGVPTMVQYFERGRLELNGSTGMVTLGQLGKASLEVQCQKAQ